MRFLFCVLLLAGCAVSQANLPLTRTLVYDCAGGLHFVARQTGANLELILPGGPQQLRRIPSASGVVYRNSGVEFWSRGEEARLNVAGQLQRQCRSDRVAAIWEDARLRGVDFRAAGSEPGWYVEMDRERIIYAGDYGQQLLTFPAVSPRLDDQLARSEFVSHNDEHRIEILLQSGDCRNSMSGELYRTRVTLHLDGQVLYGCGRLLH